MTVFVMMWALAATIWLGHRHLFRPAYRKVPVKRN